MDGIASAKLRGRVAAAEASGFGIDLQNNRDVSSRNKIMENEEQIGLILPYLSNARKHCKEGKEHEFPVILPNLANTQKN